MVVAAANSVSNEVSQTQSVESQGKHGLISPQAKGAKKSALSVFSKLLAGLADQRSIRKAKAGGDEAGEMEAEGLVSAEKNAKNKTKFPAGNEKIQNRDRHLLSALKGEGNVLSPEERLKEAVTKKTKQAGEDAEDALLAAEATLAGLSGEDPLLRGTIPGEGAEPTDQDDLLRLAGADGRLRDMKALREIVQDSVENAAEAAAKSESSRQAQGAAQGKRIPGETLKKDKPTAAETRNSKKNKDRLTLEVQDLRTGQNGAAPNTAQDLRPELGNGAERVMDITVELKNGGRGQESGESGQMKSAGQAFGDILARELHQNLNGDIVRQASIMVRDGGEGTIRLSLKPEALGMVKIRLEMAENKITGHIIVESDEALRAFEKEIRALEQAFRDSGFEGASLDMALAGDGGQGSGQGQWNREAATPLFPPQLVSSSYDAMAETMDVLGLEAGFDGFDSPGVSRINVLV